MSLSACNPDRGPEYTTPAEFGEVTVSPQTMAFDSEVRVKVSVSCPYGLRNVCILPQIRNYAPNMIQKRK